MKIKRDIIKRAFEQVKPGLASKEVIEQSTSFAFISGCVVTFNNELSISCPIPELEIEGAIHEDEIYKFISKVKTDEIDIEVNDDVLEIKSGRAKAGFKLINEIKLPVIDELGNKSDWVDLPDNFIELLNFTALCCSTNFSMVRLTCVHINNDILESTDNLRICRTKLSKPIKLEALLPYDSALTVCKYKPVKIAESNGWLHFENNEGVIISCRTVNDTFVDIEKYIKNTEIETSIITLPENLKEILSRAVVFAKRAKVNEEQVDIEVLEKRIVIRSESDYGWFEEFTRIKYSEKPVTFSIIPSMLMDILDKTNTCKIVDKILRFDSENLIYLTALRSVK